MPRNKCIKIPASIQVIPLLFFTDDTPPVSHGKENAVTSACVWSTRRPLTFIIFWPLLESRQMRLRKMSQYLQASVWFHSGCHSIGVPHYGMPERNERSAAEHVWLLTLVRGNSFAWLRLTSLYPHRLPSHRHTDRLLSSSRSHSHCNFSPPANLRHRWPAPASYCGWGSVPRQPAGLLTFSAMIAAQRHFFFFKLGPSSALGRWWRTPASPLSCLTQGSRMHELSHSTGKLCCFLSSHPLLFCAFLAMKMSGRNSGVEPIFFFFFFFFKCCGQSPNNLSLPQELFELIHFHHPIRLYCISKEFQFTKDMTLVL